jgi:hypothetical protein
MKVKDNPTVKNVTKSKKFTFQSMTANGIASFNKQPLEIFSKFVTRGENKPL